MSTHNDGKKRPMRPQLPETVSAVLDGIGAVTTAQASEIVQPWIDGTLPMPAPIAPEDLAAAMTSLREARAVDSSDDGYVRGATHFGETRMGVLPPDALTDDDTDLAHRHRLADLASATDGPPTNPDDSTDNPDPEENQ
jgi:hypothetical protein